MTGPSGPEGLPRATMRVDKWLWFARFFKTRGLSAALVTAGHLRINGRKVEKPAAAVAAGDVLTFPQGDSIRVVRLVALANRRGPAAEAQALYDDLTPPEAATKEKVPRNPGFDGKGRPTGRDRRRLDLSRKGPLE